MPKRADRNLDDSTNTNHEGSGDNDMTVSGVRVDRDRRRYVSSAQRPEGRAAARWKQASVLERLRWGFVGPSRRTNTKTLRLERADPSGTVAAKVTPPRSRPEDLKIVIENDILEVRSPEGIQWQLKLPTGTPSGNVQITPEGHQLVIRIVDRSQAEQTSWEHQPTRIEEPPTRASLDVDPPEDLRELAGLLAADAHEKWLEQRRAQGWIHGPVRDDIQMTHPDLVPYSELPEAAKEYERRFAEATLRTMLRLGVALDRVDLSLPPMPETDLPDTLHELAERLAGDAHEKWLVT